MSKKSELKSMTWSWIVKGCENARLCRSTSSWIELNFKKKNTAVAWVMYLWWWENCSFTSVKRKWSPNTTPTSSKFFLALISFLMNLVISRTTFQGGGTGEADVASWWMLLLRGESMLNRWQKVIRWRGGYCFVDVRIELRINKHIAVHVGRKRPVKYR